MSILVKNQVTDAKIFKFYKIKRTFNYPTSYNFFPSKHLQCTTKEQVDSN